MVYEGKLFCQFPWQLLLLLLGNSLPCPPCRLGSILSDPKVCYITDIIMTSKTTGEKSRVTLVKAPNG